MRIETLLPLGKVEPGLRAPEKLLDLHRIARVALLSCQWVLSYI